ncbi:AbiH family protein [Flavobacterium beibuense]|uniref:AbiH domain containing protein n=1 Tax=Flavobacterium beibuense TaxID=657326 RepID=A0A444W787_9FLAO|nr:AbiH family protein [Flavobacterium beibuense]RYJ41536.1 AbiH domain containing protein [Flavobacterium beibuense]
MNRLVIIGNGFDLAHGLPTGYCDFIDWYWEKVIEHFKGLVNSSYSDNLIEVDFYFKSISRKISEVDYKIVKDYSSFKSFIEKYSEAYELKYKDKHDRCYLKYNNSFFENICSKREIKNWVDIENEYFKILKVLVTPDQTVKYSGDIKQLNQEFEQVKNLLENYLHEKIYKGYDFTIHNNKINQICELFNVMNRFTDWNKFREEFSKSDRKEIQSYYNKLKEYNLGETYHISNFIRSQEIEIENLFLNFNYTSTVKCYMDNMRNSNANYYGTNTLLHIHGELNNPKNKMNFGFGDEMDNDYKKIEDKDDNEYLRNIKSFQYLQNPNYRKLLDFVERDKFQVYIMGHSCGLSDRILLNTIFEHQNCRSIKLFFYQNGDKDNFTDIIQNISRHFNKKKMMREKIVNKTLCTPLPQEIRFKEKNNGSRS